MSQEIKQGWSSLAQQFDAPPEYVGHFGWLCGYSADASFLDDAAERFTRLGPAQRTYQGRIALAVMLDPGSAKVSILDAPGVAHLPIKSISGKPFRLLHAKVALLGFKHTLNHEDWCLRLIVSTGNWTRQTLEDSLDLVWCIEITSSDLTDAHHNLGSKCADIKAATDLMRWLEERFDSRLLNARSSGRFSETKNAREEVDKWLNLCIKKAKGQPRFIDNRKRSLLNKLPGKIKELGNTASHNYLAMGSGFYEALASGTTPDVPGTIIQSLQENGLLTKNPQVDLYVNPQACQAIAESVSLLNDKGIKVREAAVPKPVFGDRISRGLHAKFLFSTSIRHNLNSCTSPWVYLGSGNLTNPGFAQKMGNNAGNLEAAVVFSPSSIFWEKSSADIEPKQLVTNLLPIYLPSDETGIVTSDTSNLSAGTDMEPREAVYLAPPIAWLEWFESDSISELRSDEDFLIELSVLDSSGNTCSKIAQGFQWKESQPRQVRINWFAEGSVHETSIPVIDQYGRIAATQLRATDIDEAWWQLAEFPLPSDEESDDSELADEDSDPSSSKDGATGGSVQPISYPIRQMMELVESIAAKQTEINEADWGLWCNRLEQSLSQARTSHAVSTFQELELNPLSPLWDTPFRPLFAETSESEAGKLYEETLTRIEIAWSVEQLYKLGAVNEPII